MKRNFPDGILQNIAELSAFKGLTQSLQEGMLSLYLNLPRAVRLPIAATLYRRFDLPMLLVTDRSDRALSLVDELRLWTPHVELLFIPEPNPLFYEDVPWGEATRRDRLKALTALAGYHLPGERKFASRQDSHSDQRVNAEDSDHMRSTWDSSTILVASARALMTRTLPRSDFLAAMRSLSPGDVVPLSMLSEDLFLMGYDPVNTVVSPGQFARRGGILDIWPPADTSPARLDFFGDEIDTIRWFDPATQRAQKPTPNSTPHRLHLTPAREYIRPQTDIVPPAVQPETSEPQESGNYREFHIPLLHPSPASLLDYLPKDAIVLIDNWEAFQDTINEIEEQAFSLRQDYLAAGSLNPDYPLPYLTWDQIQDALENHRTVRLGPVTSQEGTTIAQSFSPNPRFGGQIKPLLDHLRATLGHDETCVVVSRQSNRLQQLWSETAVPESAAQAPEFVQGSLSEGWMLKLQTGKVLHLLTDGEIFGWRRPQPRRRQRPVTEAPEASFADIQAGNWVVHIDHGVGRYCGLVTRAIEGAEREYLCVEYALGDQLFVPVHQADRLTLYVGPDNRPPKPTRLGGIEWRNVRSRVKKAVQEVAEELLALYAKRQTIRGTAFSPDSAWQSELESSFPYYETEDQLHVLHEVKADMESHRPMDRLVCGDVGYGKTEVALRAAFKAVMDSYQVAVLVPTTVLAQQHYYTFLERLAPFPVEVEMLSRFRSPKEQREILDRLSKGAVDIVIGTHRLLQPDVAFKNLGLLIIDEEQRFGVTHKEYLKQMRTEVDVLTMTATPIPRTLYMALTGVRDISTINTPPEERQPIVTHVGPFNKRLIRQAILRELERGGQVFFVHNRVQTIEGVRRQLTKLVPEARAAVAHGQMSEKVLAERMRKFTSGEIDILLTTSIIESGLDIPNANTLIVDRADTFGLAQLYQLRGRVGRGAQRAYAYFFRHQRKAPTVEGRQRLETIAEQTHLGAGYSIAMRDLEIRGAGDLLGTRQHGHIAAVGFHLYTRLLADAVRQLRGERVIPEPLAAITADVQRPMVSVDLPLTTSIPSNYVTDQAMRLNLYRRMASLRSQNEVDTLVSEFTERFGPPPEPVRNLFYQLKVKLLAETAGLSSVSSDDGQIVLRFPTRPEGAPSRKLPDADPRLRAGKNTIWLRREVEGGWTQHLLAVLQQLSQ